MCAALLTLTSPFTPMLFQGEEWAASTPFQFFTSHPEPELGEATAAGRLTRVRAAGLGPGRRTRSRRTPRPSERSKLDWSEAEKGMHARVLAAYQRIIELRRSLPALTDPSFGSISCTADEEARVFTMRRGDVLIAVNFGEEPAEVSVDEDLDLVFRTPSHPTLADGRAAPSCARWGPARSVVRLVLDSLDRSRLIRSLRALLDHLWLRPVPLGSGG